MDEYLDGCALSWKERLKAQDTKGGVLLVGLPGIGLIGRIAIRYMAEKLQAKKVADIYSEYFPAQALMTKKGMLRLLKQNLYLVKTKNSKKILFLTGDVQPILPEGQFKLSKTVVELAHKLNISEIITIGGYSTGTFNEKKNIFGAANNKKIIAKFKKIGVVFGQAKGSIVGMAGIIPASARTKKIPSICLMGETHGAFVDATSSRKVVELLSKYLKVDIDLKELDEVAKAGETMIKNIEKEIEKAQKGPDQKSLSYIR